MSYLFRLHKQMCTGCGACSNICTHKAITMKEDNEGFLYPEIDNHKCVNCGLCLKTCPINGNDRHNVYKHQKAYLAYASHKNYYKKSATIGICTKLAYNIIAKHGFVVGVKIDNRIWKPYHFIASKESEINDLRNSKYAQSNTNSTFIETKQLLLANKHVLYIGTPCQIAGLKAFLGKDYDNLSTIDIICHGVFSYRLLKREIAYWEEKYDGVITSFKFRSKKYYPWSMGGVINFDVESAKKKKKHIEKHARLSLTYRCFAYSGDGKCYNLRPSCYCCPFREKGRYGDITVGDAWGIARRYPEVFTMKNCKNGVSLVLINSAKGQEMVDGLNDFCSWRNIPVDHAFVQPALLPEKMPIPNGRDTIYNKFDKEDYKAVVENVLNIDFEKLRRKEIEIVIRRLVIGPIKKSLQLLLGKKVGQWF